MRDGNAGFQFGLPPVSPFHSFTPCENNPHNFTCVPRATLIHSRYKFYSRVYEQHSITRQLQGVAHGRESHRF